MQGQAIKVIIQIPQKALYNPKERHEVEFGNHILILELKQC